MKTKKNYDILLFFHLSLIANILLLICIFFLTSDVPPFSTALDPQIIQKMANTCKEDPNWRRCYGKEIAAISKNKPLTFSVALMHKLQKVDEQTLDCHLIAHSLSNSLVQKNPAKWKELLGQVPAYECVGGFIHGILETHARIDSSFEINEETIPQICDLTKVKGKSYCSHMLGHLLAVETNGDILAASDICHKLQDRKLEFACHSGAFMENITRDNLVAHQLAEHTNYTWEWALVQEKLCRQATEHAAQKACWQEITHYYNILSGKNPARLWEFCSRSPIDDGRDACFLHGVTFIAGDQKITGKNSMNTLCNPFSLEQRSRYDTCIITIVRVLLDSSTGFSNKIIELCTSSDKEDSKEKCFHQYGLELKKIIGKQKTFEMCAKVPENYQPMCKSI